MKKSFTEMRAGIQERVSIVDCSPSRGQFAKLALGWHPRGWIWGGFPLFPEKNGSLCTRHLCEQYGLCWIPTFLLGVWDFGSFYIKGAYVTGSQ